MPELLTQEEQESLQQNQDADESGSEADDSDDEDDEDEDEKDKKGNLRGFVVPDDNADSETESEAEEVNGVEEEDVAPESSTKVRQSQGIASGDTDKKKGKSKDKGKGKDKKGQKKKIKGNKHKSTVTLADLKKLASRNAKMKKKYLRRLRADYVDSAKIRKTMELLEQIMMAPESEKVLIFSQWTSLLDLLEIPIDGAGWGYRRYDGSMNTTMRGDAVDDFRDQRKNVRIMLVSLKAGNAGLNLNMASQVIILDPFWYASPWSQCVEVSS